MKNRHLVLLLMALSASLLVSTAAAPIQPTWEDRISDDVVLQPTDGPNGRHAVQNGDGKLEVVFGPETFSGEQEGLNAYGTFQFDRVFSIRNTGDDERVVWLGDDTDSIRYYRGSRPTDSLEGRANRAILESGERVNVGIYIETADADIVSTFQVNVADAGESGESGSMTDGGKSGGLRVDEGSEGGDGSGELTPTAGTTTATQTPGTTTATQTPTDTTVATGSPAAPPVQAPAGGSSFVWLLVLVLMIAVAISTAFARTRGWL